MGRHQHLYDVDKGKSTTFAIAPGVDDITPEFTLSHSRVHQIQPS